MENSKKFSGYSVAVSLGIVLFITTGALGTFGVFLPAIISSEGYSTAAVALMATCCSTVCFLVNSIMSKVISKIGAKLALLLGCLFCMGHYIVYGSSKAIWQIYIGGAMGGVAMGLATSAMASILLTRWFVEKREKVIGAVMVGIGFGGAAFAWLAGQCIAAFGWRHAYFVLAAVISVITLPVILLFVKESPASCNQLPLGATEVPAEEVVQKKVKQKHAEMKTGSFWVLYIGMFFIGALAPSIKFFMTSCWQGYGMDKTVSSNYLSLALLLAAIGFAVAGQIAQKAGTQKTIAFFVVCYVLMMVCMAMSKNLSPVWVVLACVFYALSAPSQHLTSSLTTMSAYGPEAYGRLLGVFHGGAMFSSAFTSFLIGWIKDMTGSYQPALITMGAVAIISFLFLEIGLKTAPYHKSQAKAG